MCGKTKQNVINGAVTTQFSKTNNHLKKKKKKSDILPQHCFSQSQTLWKPFKEGWLTNYLKKKKNM